MKTDITLPPYAQNSVNLASPRIGSEVLFATDDFFADKARLLHDAEPLFHPGTFDLHGQWMDGWESRRRRNSGHDYCIIKLGVASLISGVDIDTSHFTGNYPPAASIEACVSDDPLDENARWFEIVPPTNLGPSAHHFVEVQTTEPYRHLRLHMWPDGGIARLRVYGEPVCNWSREEKEQLQELSAITNGGRVVGFNDSHYGDPWVILTEGRGVNMGDGWETRRRREPGNDWIIVKLGASTLIEKIEIDTAHFKGNFPDQCSIQAALCENGTDESIITQSIFWDEVLPAQQMKMDLQHFYEGGSLNVTSPVNYVKLNIHPDGGVSRLRIYGRPI